VTDVDRRSFLRLSGGGAVAATTGGMAAILATGRAPAYAQASVVHPIVKGTTSVSSSSRTPYNSDQAANQSSALSRPRLRARKAVNAASAIVTTTIPSATYPPSARKVARTSSRSMRFLITSLW